MSADSGYILRRNEDGKYVLQLYFLSSGDYPVLEDADAEQKFSTLEQAMMRYEELQNEEPSEYGLKVDMGLIRRTT